MSLQLKRDYDTFVLEAKKISPDRVFTDFLLSYAYGIDASCYSYLPKVVVKANTEAEVVQLVLLANRCGTPVTFRAAGSSLSGQASSEDVLIVANDGFKFVQVLENGNAIRLACGVIGADANEALKPYGKKIGPDTITTALVGGIFNNNSSGMCCGTVENSYKTVRSMRVVLADGTILDTGNPQSVKEFMASHSKLVDDVLNLRSEIMTDSELVDLIRRKYKIKNTTGYGINSLVDFEDIVDILNHIFIGSEGTLGFVSEVVYNCVDDAKYKGCGLLFFANLEYIKDQLKDIPTVIPSLYSKDAKEYDAWWIIRKGLLPIAAGLRRPGTTVITEDVCFKIEDFTDGIEMITELFKKYDFEDSGIIFGHALSGNVHFIITPNFNEQREMDNFSGLVKEMAERVAGVEGSIKAEHGTGRMVAPFVELEWGKKAYAVNRRIKEIFDPQRLLNPDVMITDDPDIYKKNLKAMSDIDPLYNMCMECGFCERNCPSRNLTLTPRQRISLLREEHITVLTLVPLAPCVPCFVL